jgi:hypothetical protein
LWAKCGNDHEAVATGTRHWAKAEEMKMEMENEKEERDEMRDRSNWLTNSRRRWKIRKNGGKSRRASALTTDTSSLVVLDPKSAMRELPIRVA